MFLYLFYNYHYNKKRKKKLKLQTFNFYRIAFELIWVKNGSTQQTRLLNVLSLSSPISPQLFKWVKFKLRYMNTLTRHLPTRQSSP